MVANHQIPQKLDKQLSRHQTEIASQIDDQIKEIYIGHIEHSSFKERNSGLFTLGHSSFNL